MDEKQAAGSLAEHWDKIFYHPLAAAVTGAVMAGFHAFPGATRSAKLINGISSFLIGVYLGPAVNEYAGVGSERVQALVIVACALGGLIVANAFLDYLRTTRFSDLPFVRRVLDTKADSHKEVS